MIEQVRKLGWKRWIQRPFRAFIVSLFSKGMSSETYKSLGLEPMRCLAYVFQDKYFYESKKVWDDGAEKAMEYLKDHTMLNIIDALDKFYAESLKRIYELNESDEDVILRLKEFVDIMYKSCAFIWIAHSVEHAYNKKLQEEVPKYVKEDVDQFIGDASYPSKKNKQALLEEAVRRGDNPDEIIQKYGWMKARNLFDKGLTADDLKDIGKEEKEEHKRPEIPDELKELFEEVQALVYFRTARTDVFYEFLFRAQPLLREVADHYGIKCEDLEDYSAQSLIAGEPEKHKPVKCCISYKGEGYFLDKPLIEDEVIGDLDSVKGVIAQKGVVKGTVKVVQNVSELGKVEKGDILVTQMTFPAFITAMEKAAAFVTDEGGITCHAAIVAREMKKPCVIGTKIATKVFKDGDIVEVDGEKGVVRRK